MANTNDEIQYHVRRRDPNSWDEDGIHSLIAEAGDHRYLVDALVECDARNVRDVSPGSSPIWAVESDDPADYDKQGYLLTSYIGDVDESQVWDYLVDHLGVSEPEATRLLL